MIRRLAGGRVFTDYHDEAWHVSLLRIALIALMAGSFAAWPVIARYGFGASWTGYLLPFTLLCGAAGALTTSGTSFEGPLLLAPETVCTRMKNDPDGATNV
mgnify:CR=1 FL=1